MTELELRSSEITRDWVALMAPAVELARQVAGTGFVPAGLRNDPPGIVAAILYGDEIGLGPMQALSKIAMINGSPTLASEAQRAKILADGHELWVVDANTTKATVAGRRRGSDQTSTVTWTMDDAKRANLAGKQNWRLYPRQMLLARAFAELARMVFPDSIGGLYATEEIEEGEPGFSDEPVRTEANAKPPTTKRKRERAKPPASETSGELPPAAEPPLPPLPHELESPPAIPVSEDVSPVGQPVPPAAEMPDGESGPTTGGASAAETSGDTSAGTGLGDEEPVPSPSGAGGDATDAQKKLLNMLVGRLREAGFLKTENIWTAVSSLRGVDVGTLVALHGGLDEEGVLRWSPLRDSLDKTEATNLIDRLQRYEQNVEETAS